jgi:glutamyl/glutaminyl-tRNA synthetase
MNNFKNNVRVRFAPSPTGSFHIGNARTALFNWLYAKKTEGKFILRIEDTNKIKNSFESTQEILSGMKWLGIDWDEGPIKEGSFGPYYQSLRQSIYKSYLNLLRKKNLIYKKNKCTYFRVSNKKKYFFDLIYGKKFVIEKKDFIIIRSDKTPIFHFTNVVDDVSMNITHIIRGKDHFSNMGKHMELFYALDYNPIFAHIPLILNETKKGKISKRDLFNKENKLLLIKNCKSNQIIPEALNNYLCLLGWSNPNKTEFFKKKQIINVFNLKKVQKSHSHFNIKKMLYINRIHLLNLSKKTFLKESKAFLFRKNIIDNKNYNNEYILKVISLIRRELTTFNDLKTKVGYFFQENYQNNSIFLKKINEFKILNNSFIISFLKEFYIKLGNKKNKDYPSEILKNILNSNYSKKKYIKYKKNIFITIRFIISGRKLGPSLYLLLNILKKNKIRKRLKNFFLIKKSFFFKKLKK